MNESRLPWPIDEGGECRSAASNEANSALGDAVVAAGAGGGGIVAFGRTSCTLAGDAGLDRASEASGVMPNEGERMIEDDLRRD